jgi:hypothetical protein
MPKRIAAVHMSGRTLPAAASRTRERKFAQATPSWKNRSASAVASLLLNRPTGAEPTTCRTDRGRFALGRMTSASLSERALFNWTTSGRPIDSYDLTKEVDSVITTTAQMYRDTGTTDALVVARSLLLLNRPGGALAKVESVLIKRARSYETK